VNKLKLLSALSALLFSGLASAQAVVQNVDVQVTLTSQCRAATATPALITVDFGTYTAFGAGIAAAATPATLTIECTRNYAPAATVAWDGATALGVVAGLQYTLSVSAGAVSAGAPATTASTGSGDTRVYTIGGSMPAGQAGDNTAATTASRTLTLTF
jgi:hypothetical protein